MRRPGLYLMALAALASTACGGDDDPERAADAAAAADAGADAAERPLPEAIAIVGDYVDDFGGAHQITATEWRQGEGDAASVFALREVDNEARFALAENGADNEFSPGLWSRFDWAESGGALYFCQSAFDAATLDAARAATPGDAADLAGAGCGGFPWSALTRR